MKTIKILAVLFLLTSTLQIVNAQVSEAEKKLMDIEAQKAAAKAAVGKGGDDNLNTLVREAEVGEDPCTLYDDDEWYTAFNQQEGKRGDPQLANSLLRTNQQQLRDKLSQKVKQITNGYFDQMDVNGNSSIAEHIEGASQMVAEQMLKETREYCRKTSNPDPQSGNIIMYMSIRIKKQDLLNNIVNEISNDNELKVRFNEKKFREEAFKVFDEGTK